MYKIWTEIIRIFEICHLTDTIRNGIENDLVTISVQFDFRKAFDSICHQSLLFELRSLGFLAGALHLIHFYITGRSQAVVDQDHKPTNFDNTSSGVPQGSSPGPIFFLALINSLPKLLNSVNSVNYYSPMIFNYISSARPIWFLLLSTT